MLSHINTRKYAARNKSMMLLTHWAGLRIGEVARLRWSDVTTTDGLLKDETLRLQCAANGRAHHASMACNVDFGLPDHAFYDFALTEAPSSSVRLSISCLSASYSACLRLRNLPVRVTFSMMPCGVST